jgi:CBS domain-containing protein
MQEGEGHFVEDVMQKNVIAIDSSATIKDAAIMMTDTHVGCVIITDGSSPIGIVTERDIVQRVVSEDIPLSTSVSEIMSTNLITAKLDFTLWELAQLMKTNSIHKMPVEKDGNLVGIITATDLVRANSLASGTEIGKITEQILVRISKNS